MLAKKFQIHLKESYITILIFGAKSDPQRVGQQNLIHKKVGQHIYEYFSKREIFMISNLASIFFIKSNVGTS